MGNVLIVAEHQDGKLRTASLSALSLGMKLAEVSGGGDLVGLLTGGDTADAAKELSQYALARVLTVNDPGLGSYQAETYATVVAAVAKSVDAEFVCATATTMGKDLMPRVAALLDTAMASDVSEVIGPRSFKRPMVAGNAIGTIEVMTPTVVVTARQTEWEVAKPSGSHAQVASADAGEFQALGAEVLETKIAQSTRPDLTDASVVVSGGRGLKSAENFQHVEALADALGGAMGATRAACDAGMVPNDLQVGQTGKVVAPDLYIAVGISGAIQHLAGMKGSKVIVAINTDPEAPIFQVADYGLVAKWEDTLDELTERVKAIKSA